MLDLQNTFSDMDTFETLWRVSAGDVVELSTRGSFTIDWGDGTVEDVSSEVVLGSRRSQEVYRDLAHKYVIEGDYVISIGVGITQFLMSLDTVRSLIDVRQWGGSCWGSMERMFEGAINMTCSALDAPDLSRGPSFNHLFGACRLFNGSIRHWDFSEIKTLHSFLSGASSFNRSFEGVDLRSAKSVDFMLSDTLAFDQDLNDLRVADEVSTDNIFGLNRSLLDYNERYNSRREKVAVERVLSG